MCAQPSNLHYAWQVETMLNNLHFGWAKWNEDEYENCNIIHNAGVTDSDVGFF
jgi:hypothetical protein